MGNRVYTKIDRYVHPDNPRHQSGWATTRNLSKIPYRISITYIRSVIPHRYHLPNVAYIFGLVTHLSTGHQIHRRFQIVAPLENHHRQSLEGYAEYYQWHITHLLNYKS
jgi:hypothetical protein